MKGGIGELKNFFNSNLFFKKELKVTQKLYCKNKIPQGGYTERMAKLPSGCIDLIITDLPYLVNYKDRKGRGIKNDTSDNCADWLIPSFK